MENNIRVEKYNKDKHFKKVLRMKLREADQRELLASSDCPSYAVGLQRSVEASDLVCYVYLYEDRIIALSGAASTEFDFALVWAMASDEVFEHWKEVEPLFIKHVNAVLDIPGVVGMGNVIDLRNKAHIKWIKRLGFTLTGIIIKLGGYDFESFYKSKEGVLSVTLQ